MQKLALFLPLALVSCSRTHLEFEELDVDASPPIPMPDAPVPDDCIPEDEECNGVDDDCDGQVDEGIPPVPCPAGDQLQMCLRGVWSVCSCACVPGATRQCFETYCTGWGVQRCTADGEWGDCRETQPMDGCGNNWDPDPDDERCCIERGGCCADEFDLDGDGDRLESLGNCGGATCG